MQNDPSKFLPKFLPIYHSMSCHGSCDWNLKISSPQASGAWGAQLFPPYSIQKRPEPQICPKFVPAIGLGGSSLGGQKFVKTLSKFEKP